MSILSFYNFKNKAISKITILILLIISYKTEIHCVITNEILLNSLSYVDEDYHLVDYSFLPKKMKILIIKQIILMWIYY